MKFKYIAFISLFFIVVSMITVVDAKIIEITEENSQKEIKDFFKNNGKIDGKKLSKGDTIIFKTNYYEYLKIEKTLTIKTKGTVELCPYSKMTITANNVKIEGVNKIGNIKIIGNKCIIRNSVIEDIYLKGNKNIIKDSVVDNIVLRGNENKVTRNSKCSIEIRGSKNIADKNKINKLSYNGGTRCIEVYGSKNKITNNIISGGSDGVTLYKGTKNLISKNTIKGMYWNAMYVFSSNNRIELNKFISNNCGIYSHYKSKNKIGKNKYTNNNIKRQSFS